MLAMLAVVTLICLGPGGYLVYQQRLAKREEDAVKILSQSPANQTRRVPHLALSSGADGSGANTRKSNAGRRPMAATRSETIRIGRPGSSRLNDTR